MAGRWSPSGVSAVSDAFLKKNYNVSREGGVRLKKRKQQKIKQPTKKKNRDSIIQNLTECIC